MHLQWFRHLCQHKAWTLCLGLVDRKRFPMLQQFIPKVGKYYNLRDNQEQQRRDGWKERHVRHHLSVTWMHVYLSHTYKQGWNCILHHVRAALGWASTTGASAKPSQAQHTFTWDCVWGQNLWELWFRTLYRPFQQPVKMQFLNWSGRF